MFQITRRADYAVRILLTLGGNPAGTMTPARGLAAATGVPRAFLYRLTAQLARAGLVCSSSGPGGGLTLARPPAKINMLQILEAVDGRLCLNVCLIRPHDCPREHLCPAHGLWGRLQIELAQHLRRATLARLLADGQALAAAVANPRLATPGDQPWPMRADRTR